MNKPVSIAACPMLIVLCLGACAVPSRLPLRPMDVTVDRAEPATPPPPGRLEPASVDPEVAGLLGARAWWMIRGGSQDRVYVLEAGPRDATAVPLVLVHGLGTKGVRDFYPVLEELASNRRVLLLDLPGLARSGLTGKPSLLRYDAAIDMVVAARLGDRAYDLLGHSLGGATALLHAARHADRVRRLVLVDVAGILHFEAFVDSQLDAMAASSSVVTRRVGALARTFRDVCCRGTRNERFMHRYEKGASAQTKAAIALILFDMGPYFAEVKAPTLLLWGRKDTIAPLRTARLLEDRIKPSRLEVLDEVAHVPMAEAPEEFVRAVRCHLDELRCAKPPARPRAAKSGAASCKGKANQVFRGRYTRVSIDGCQAVLDGAMVDVLDIRDSNVELINTRVLFGLRAQESTVAITGGEVSGDVGVLLVDSTSDLAGVVVRGHRAAIQALTASRLVLSATLLDSPHTTGALHGVFSLGEGQGF